MSPVDPATFLGALAQHERDAVLTAGRGHKFATGAHIIRQGDHGTSVFVIQRGRAKVTSVTPTGLETVCAIEAAGSLVGHWEAVEPGRLGRHASVVALEPVDSREISREEFLRLLEGHPRLSVELLRLTIRTSRSADRRRPIPERSDTPPRRLARLLIDCVEHTRAQQQSPTSRGIDLGLALTQQELAGMLGTSRASVVRALGALRQDRIISTSPRRLVVNDVDALRAMAD